MGVFAPENVYVSFFIATSQRCSHVRSYGPILLGTFLSLILFGVSTMQVRVVFPCACTRCSSQMYRYATIAVRVSLCSELPWLMPF